MRDPESHRREIAWIRARNVAYTIVQLAGFGVLLWGLFEVLRPGLVDYYKSQAQPLPGVVVELTAVVPELDQLTAVVVFALGVVIVWFSTR